MGGGWGVGGKKSTVNDPCNESCDYCVWIQEDYCVWIQELTLLVHPPLQDPTQLGRDPGRTGHIVSALLFAPPFSTPNPGIHWVRGTVEWGEPPSLYPS